MALNSKQKTGLIVILASIFIGILGTVWNIYGSFEALQTAEKFGIAGMRFYPQCASLFSGRLGRSDRRGISDDLWKIEALIKYSEDRQS